MALDDGALGEVMLENTLSWGGGGGGLSPSEKAPKVCVCSCVIGRKTQ